MALVSFDGELDFEVGTGQLGGRFFRPFDEMDRAAVEQIAETARLPFRGIFHPVEVKVAQV